ncbi:ankyrin repeat-containing domain protein [Leptodontidium sp. 2 PMI_412]|nr:ankyrin repeat-containing domain protein [Leptodontidium sp. 2 PMI_412]
MGLRHTGTEDYVSGIEPSYFHRAITSQFRISPVEHAVPEKNDGFNSLPRTPTHTLERTTTNTLQRTATRNHGQANPVKEKKTVKMAPTVSKPQMNCLELCHKTTMSIDLIAVHILEYLTTAKQLAYGFEPLAHDFLDTCQILFSIEAGLGECNRSGQKLPQEMLTELDHKFRVTQADFNILNQMLIKMITPTSKLARSWGKLFGDNDIKKISMALAKTRESLKLSSLMFQWSLGEENTEKEKGIGFTGLHFAQPQAPWSNRSSSIHQDGSMTNGRMTFSSGLQPQTPGSPDLRHHTVSTMHTNGSDLMNPYDPYGRHSAMDDARSVTNITEPDSFHEDIAILDLETGKVVRHSVDPSSMPRVYPRNGMESDTTNMKGALLVEQLLHRGVSPNLGFNMHPLKEAVLSHDEESLRLLLLDSITPLFVCVERSFLTGATMLVKYGADPNLVAGPEMESPLAVAVMGNMVAFTYLFLSHNGDANHMTASGSPILISAIKKKTPKKFIDMLLEEGHTALFDAINLGRADIVISLLEHKADPNLPGPKHMLWPAVHHSQCLQAPGIMELAVSINSMDPDVKKDGVAEMFKLLIANKADPNLPASEYPAFKCVTHDRVHFLAPLGIIEEAVNFNNGVNPNDRSPKGHSALTTAIRENRPELVELLLKRGADPHVRGENWPLCMAVAKPPILKRLLTVVKEPQAFKGIMEMAVHADQLESVKMLLAAGVSVEDKNGGVFSPLTTAIREDHRPIVKYLLTDGGADVNSPGEHLPIVKSLRTYRGNETEILELLLEHGADPNMMYRGWNGIMQAVENGEPDVLRLLARKAGVDLEVRDEMGRTVVEMAASRGWDEAVQILIEGDMGLRMRK